MTATIIDGKAIGLALRHKIADQVRQIVSDGHRAPGLAVVLVGQDPASTVYVRNKTAATQQAGMVGFEHYLAADTTEQALLALIDQLNQNPAVDGILVQLPLPNHINPQHVVDAIDPAKDVDGFHPVNIGALSLQRPDGFVPCTPQGCMILLRHHHGHDLAGRHAVVLGRSAIVGKPMAQLLLAADCTVTIAHSRSQNLPDLCRQADILVAAVGRPEMVRGDWMKAGATMIDVGINRIDITKPDGTPGSKLVGDIHFAEASQRAGAITPVPGGVGPMTIACLLANTLKSARQHLGLAAQSFD
jgi:methylenetetrahydrofolate dehydrogenase (NADP+)/methenyltetrahydrofolate cyclohydrolase